MKNGILALLLAVIVGSSVNAFYKPSPTLPYQVAGKIAADTFIPRGGSSFDSGLDNAEIETDGNITPSRKCGFCMG
ncbi:MAG: hypothetical protein ACI8RD_011858 [Bacillariaceae sp.]|jgi:hypothetical protein